MSDEFAKRAQEAIELARAFGFKGTEQALVNIFETHQHLPVFCSKDTHAAEPSAKVN